jgi:periplasmic protein TonB
VTETLLLDELERQREGDPPVRDRLTTTFFLVAMLHAIVILGVTFSPPRGGAGEARSLEVLLVRDPVPDAAQNPKADYLAQVTQHGAGNLKDASGAESPRPTPSVHGASAADEEAGAAEPGGLEGELDLLATSAPAGSTYFFRPHANAGRPAGGALAMASPAMASGADKGDQLRLKGQASGNPILEVQILDDGVLGEALVRRSSGFSELDQAALSILKLASPFAPFPDRLARKHDALRLIYEWQFLDGRLQDSSVRMPENTQ